MNGLAVSFELFGGVRSDVPFFRIVGDVQEREVRLVIVRAELHDLAAQPRAHEIGRGRRLQRVLDLRFGRRHSRDTADKHFIAGQNFSGGSALKDDAIREGFPHRRVVVAVADLTNDHSRSQLAKVQHGQIALPKVEHAIFGRLVLCFGAHGSPN